ncbi:MAG: hypothetical protein WKF68_05550 [Daejeonella sp.]
MYKNICITAILGIALFASCSKEVDEIQFTPSVNIQFAEGGDSSIVKVAKGVMDYTVKVDVSATGSVIRSFEIYTADIKTGVRGTLISGTTQTFPSAKNSYSTTYTVSSLTDNKGIKIVVTDTLSRVYEKNILIKITPSVTLSDVLKLETVENLYGPYFATWLSGRAYMRTTTYTKEIDISLGDVAIPAGSATKSPALVNPALRSQYNLLTPAGLQNTKFALTALKPADYAAINKVNAKPITDLADPTLDVVALQTGNVYLFKTENGKKGLISVTTVASKAGTIENVSGKWEPTTYYEVTLSTKTVSP